jgi:pentatricopeptide repeat protein
MLQAYRIHKQPTEALQLFKEMEKYETIPTEYVYSGIISALADMENLDEGHRILQQLKVR